jgi:hypothetical protein
MIRHFDLGSFVGRSLIFSSTPTAIMESILFLVDAQMFCSRLPPKIPKKLQLLVSKLALHMHKTL